MKKIVLTGGGTLGHVTPHLALIPRLLEKGYEIHYVGTENGMEAPKMRSVEGVTYHAVKSGKLRRYFVPVIDGLSPASYTDSDK